MVGRVDFRLAFFDGYRLIGLGVLVLYVARTSPVIPVIPLNRHSSEGLGSSRIIQTEAK
jgi:hypothetical protein